MQDTSDCLLYAHDRLLVTSGLKDIVIVETSDAVLVADREQSHEIGVLAKQLQKQGRAEASLHRCAFRPWGSYTVLEKSAGYQVKTAESEAGGGTFSATSSVSCRTLGSSKRAGEYCSW